MRACRKRNLSIWQNPKARRWRWRSNTPGCPINSSPAGRAEVLAGCIRAVAERWALCGGGLLVAVVLFTAASAAGNFFFNKPIPGDFEFAEIAVAVAAFSFLPYCQLTGANVRADIFFSRAGPKTLAALSGFSSLVAAAFAALLLWRMSEGMLDYREDGEVTHILGFPVWAAFPPILFSLLLLFLSALLTAFDSVRAFQKAPGGKPS